MRRQNAEEHEGRILVEQLVQPLRMCCGPGLNALHGRLRQGQLALIDQPSPDRAVGVAVVIGVADAQQGSVTQLNAARALHLQKEELDRIVRPGQHFGGQTGAEFADLASGPVWIEGLTVEPAAQAAPLQVGLTAAQFDIDQVVGYAVDRPRGGGVVGRPSGDQWFVVAGDHAPGAAVRVADLPRAETGPQELPNAGAAGCGTECLDDAAFRLPKRAVADGLAGLLQRRPCRIECVRLPARQLCEFGRMPGTIVGLDGRRWGAGRRAGGYWRRWHERCRSRRSCQWCPRFGDGCSGRRGCARGAAVQQCDEYDCRNGGKWSGKMHRERVRWRG